MTDVVIRSLENLDKTLPKLVRESRIVPEPLYPASEDERIRLKREEVYPNVLEMNFSNFRRMY